MVQAICVGVIGDYRRDWRVHVPQVGIINPSEMNPVNSIGAAVLMVRHRWTRRTLIGAILGAGVVNAVKTYFTINMRSLAIDFGRVVCGRHLI